MVRERTLRFLRLALIPAALSWLGLGPVAVIAAEITGTVSLVSGARSLRASEAVDAVVYFRPRVPFERQPTSEPAIMTTRRKQFFPSVLPVVAGTTVRFPNEDVILHNAFSSSPRNQFDTGIYGEGEGAEHRFEQPGLVKVYCNVHHSMFAHILVLDTPFFVRPDARGRYRLTGLPEGEGELVVFHGRSTPYRKVVDASEVVEIDIKVELTARKVPPHMNKFGKPYGRPLDGDRY